MVDIGPLFALGQGLAAEAIRTSGTTVQIETRASSTDPDTLATVTTATALTPNIPAIVVPAGNANATAQPLPGVDVRPSDWKVIVLPDVTPPPVGAWVVIASSLDPNQPARDAKVVGHVISSAGAVLTIYARPGAPT